MDGFDEDVLEDSGDSGENCKSYRDSCETGYIEMTETNQKETRVNTTHDEETHPINSKIARQMLDAECNAMLHNLSPQTPPYHIALLFFASLFFCSPSSLELLSPKKLLFFFCGGLCAGPAPGFAPDIMTALELAAELM